MSQLSFAFSAGGTLRTVPESMVVAVAAELDEKSVNKDSDHEMMDFIDDDVFECSQSGDGGHVGGGSSNVPGGTVALQSIHEHQHTAKLLRALSAPTNSLDHDMSPVASQPLTTRVHTNCLFGTTPKRRLSLSSDSSCSPAELEPMHSSPVSSTNGVSTHTPLKPAQSNNHNSNSQQLSSVIGQSACSSSTPVTRRPLATVVFNQSTLTDFSSSNPKSATADSNSRKRRGTAVTFEQQKRQKTVPKTKTPQQNSVILDYFSVVKNTTSLSLPPKTDHKTGKTPPKDPNLIGDFSRVTWSLFGGFNMKDYEQLVLNVYSLDRESFGNRSGLPSITPETLCGALQEAGSSEKYVLIDCRYPFEYAAGHIKNAVNVYDVSGMNDVLFGCNQENNTSTTSIHTNNRILIFYCEFSQKRGPSMYRKVRNLDRKQNVEYPRLHYPEMYLLAGGYKRFFNECKDVCAGGYIPMVHPLYTEQLKQYRSAKHSTTPRRKPSFRKTKTQ